MIVHHLTILAYSIVIGMILYACMTMSNRQYPIMTQHRSICIAGAVFIYELMIYAI
jgi:hypothetical protein